MTSQLSVNQAATYFDISHRTVHRWIQSGKVKAASQKTVDAQRQQLEEARRPQPLLARLKAVFAPE